MIYFAQPADGGAVKIGFSGDVKARVRYLETYYSRPLILLATMEGDREVETEIKERFAHLRFGRTEQFRPAPELMEFIGRPLLASPNPDAVEVMLPSSGATPNAVVLRGSLEWREWLKRAAASEQSSMAEFVDRAVRLYAKKIKFNEEAPER